MKLTYTNHLLQLLGLLTCVVFITFCFNHGQKVPANPAILSGKWRLLHIEEPNKIVMPPTDVIKLELEFDEESLDNHTAGEGRAVKGNVFSGNFIGTASFNVKELEGELHMEAMQVTEDILLKSYKQFDDYYLQQLIHAKTFTIKQRMLIITSKDDTDLIYTRVGRN